MPQSMMGSPQALLCRSGAGQQVPIRPFTATRCGAGRTPVQKQMCCRLGRHRLQPSLQRFPQQSLQVEVRRRASVISQAGGGGQSQPRDATETAISAGLGLLWVAVLVYVFTLSPNQTPYRDQYYLEKLVGLGSQSTEVNPVFFALFNIMGIYPALYAAVLNPSARSRNSVPLAPFLALSFGAGVFALLPYFALWAPLPAAEQQLPPKSELGLVRKALESPVVPALLLAASVFLIGMAATAGGEAWDQYVHLFDESRFVHVTSIDFCLLTALLPFWIVNDSTFRKWKYQDSAAFLGLIPLIGPALYLLLRPRSQ